MGKKKLHKRKLRELKEPRDAVRLANGELAFRPPRRVNLNILIITLLMLGFGLVMLFSASMTRGFYREDSPTFYVARQILFTVLGLLAVLFITRRDLKRIASRNTMILIYIAITVLLILVLIPGIGIKVNDQRRWLPLGSQTFQPSELAKMAVIFCGGCYYPWLRKQRAAGRFQARTVRGTLWKDFWMDIGLPGMATGIWCFLIMLQSHFSAALIIFIELFIVFLAAGISTKSWKRLGLIVAVTAAFITLVILVAGPAIRDAMAANPRMDHIVDRIDSFRGVGANDTSYQPDQALIAIGSGGFTGLGLGMGVQKYNYLPEAHNDYIYAIICEELGFLGGTLVIVLFAAYLVNGIKVTVNTRNLFSQIVAAGFSTLIVVQAMLSIAVNLQAFPSTGVSLPFFSYGGTSNIFFLVGVGILLNVSKFGLTSRSVQREAGNLEKAVAYE